MKIGRLLLVILSAFVCLFVLLSSKLQLGSEILELGPPTSPSQGPEAPRCEGVDLVKPAAALAASSGTWDPLPHFRRNIERRVYSGLNRQSPSVPTWIFTRPNASATIYPGSSPFSPSGRFVAFLRFPRGAEGNSVGVGAVPGSPPLEFAEVVVADLMADRERIVAVTRGWDSQAGAYLQWGASDKDLFYNDVVVGTLGNPMGEGRDKRGRDDHARPVGMKINPFTGVHIMLECPVTSVSPDGFWAISPCLRRALRVRPGYGIHVPGSAPPSNSRAEEDDGLYITETYSGECKLLVSYATLSAAAGRERFDPSLATYGVDASFNREQTLILFIVSAAGLNHVFVLNVDGSQIRHILAYAGNEGSHPVWGATGDHILMNLQYPTLNDPWSIVKCSVHGGKDKFEACFTVASCGSGVPVEVGIYPEGSTGLVVTGASPRQCGGFRGLMKPGAVPLRLVTVPGNATAPASEVELLQVMVATTPKFGGTDSRSRESAAWRCELHPAFDRHFKWVAFNGRPDGKRRQVMASYLGDPAELWMLGVQYRRS